MRAWAVRWSEQWLAEPGHPLAGAVLRLMDDPSWTVRRQVAASIGELPPGQRLAPALAMLRRYGTDPLTVDATLSGLRGIEPEASIGCSRPSPLPTTPKRRIPWRFWRGPWRAPARPRTSAASSIGWPRASSRPGVRRGARAGARDRPAARRSGRGRSGAGRTSQPHPVRLAEPPRELLALATGSGEIAALAKAVAAALDWPGKPASVAEVRTLTPAEEHRFQAGREIYGNLCSGCHRADGRGSEKVAPALVGSPLLAGDASLPIRVVLAGMEGDPGLMPPLGTLTDDEVAAVLTYVRREWGNTASPVDPADVKEDARPDEAPHSPVDPQGAGGRSFTGRPPALGTVRRAGPGPEGDEGRTRASDKRGRRFGLCPSPPREGQKTAPTAFPSLYVGEDRRGVDEQPGGR